MKATASVSKITPQQPDAPADSLYTSAHETNVRALFDRIKPGWNERPQQWETRAALRIRINNWNRS